MKRIVVLTLLLLVVVASITGTNAAFSRQIVLPADDIQLATPTPGPTIRPIPTVTPMPTVTPKPLPWTGEFEIIVRFQDRIWRSENPEHQLGNMYFDFYNRTGKGTIEPIHVAKWELTFKANLDIGSPHNAQLNKLASNHYRLTNNNWRAVLPGKTEVGIGAGVSTYDLTRSVNNVKTRTTHPSLFQLVFSQASLRIATDSYEGNLQTLASNRFKITFEIPTRFDDYTRRWEEGVVYPPNWALVH